MSLHKSQRECLEHETEVQETTVLPKAGKTVPRIFVLKCKLCRRVLARESKGKGVVFPYKGKVIKGPEPESLV